MIDLAMMDRLLRALREDARLVLLGDADQLPSIEAGAVFRDLCAGAGRRAPHGEPARGARRRARGASSTPRRRSTRDGRRALRGGGDDAARRWRSSTFEGVEHLAAPWAEVGDALLDRWWRARIALDSDDFARGVWRATFRLRDGELDDDDAAELRALFEHHARSRLLCATRVRGFATGAEAINDAAARAAAGRRARRGAGAAAGALARGRRSSSQRNDYERGLFNGDQGLVVPRRPGGRRRRRGADGRLPARRRFDAFPLDALRRPGAGLRDDGAQGAGVGVRPRRARPARRRHAAAHARAPLHGHDAGAPFGRSSSGRRTCSPVPYRGRVERLSGVAERLEERLKMSSGLDLRAVLNRRAGRRDDGAGRLVSLERVTPREPWRAAPGGAAGRRSRSRSSTPRCSPSSAPRGRGARALRPGGAARRRPGAARGERAGRRGRHPRSRERARRRGARAAVGARDGDDRARRVDADAVPRPAERRAPAAAPGAGPPGRRARAAASARTSAPTTRCSRGRSRPTSARGAPSSRLLSPTDAAGLRAQLANDDRGGARRAAQAHPARVLARPEGVRAVAPASASSRSTATGRR